MFGSDEILWYKNGKWGECGYAIPNPAGKTWTNNAIVYQLVQLVGRNIFELAHREDAKFYAPPHKQFWYDLHQLIITARKRLADYTRAPNDSNGLVTVHATPAPQVFLCYPVPYFGERIRQPDIRMFTQLSTLMISEMMQHSDNEHHTYLTPDFSGLVGTYLREILAQMSMKYFVKTRTEAYDPAFKLADADFQGYNPAAVMTSVEMSEERPPLQWWPTENDLSQIRGLAINDALLFGTRWPATALLAQADGNVTVSATTAAAPGTTQPTASQVSFVVPPGQAP